MCARMLNDHIPHLRSCSPCQSLVESRNNGVPQFIVSPDGLFFTHTHTHNHKTKMMQENILGWGGGGGGRNS